MAGSLGSRANMSVDAVAEPNGVGQQNELPRHDD